MAIARAKTSRPQPWVAEIGAVNSPKLARTPKVSTAIRQPQATITAGVRQPGPLELDPPWRYRHDCPDLGLSTPRRNLEVPRRIPRGSFPQGWPAQQLFDEVPVTT